MGVIKQGILGGFSGKVANVVGSSWKGIAVIKAKPLSVANPRTAGQVAQRSTLSAIVADARLLLAALIQPFWNPFAQKMSGYNDFVKTNIAAYDENGLNTPASFFSMRGSLLGVVAAVASASAATNNITINWPNNTGQSDALGTDEINVVIYNETQGYWVADMGSAIRSAATVVVTDTVMAQADVLRVYTSASRPDVSKVSDSVYGTINVAA